MDDLREYIRQSEELGECKVLQGAAVEEIGPITAWQSSLPGSPVVVFDRIDGYKPGYRVVANMFATPRRIALALGLPLESRGIGLVQAWRDRVKEKVEPIPPVEVAYGPVLENIHEGDDVDIFEFPTPKWHELDGGRYIGTGCVVIMRDPDEGWVNVGTYRVQIHDRAVATVYISPGKQGDTIRRKYWKRGMSCPVAVACGQQPMLWAVSGASLRWGMPEYDYTGWLMKKPVEVVKGIITGLPIPATAEIVLEGEIVPPEVESRIEGPFGEGPGYYASNAAPEACFFVKAVLHRNDPILQGNAPDINQTQFLGNPLRRAARLWAELDSQIPGVKGVWEIAEAGVRSMIVISLEQQYGGHAKQAALLASSLTVTGYRGRWIIVVDDDIDPSNMTEVFWALGTRADPESVDVLRGCWGTSLDPLLSPEKRKRRDFTHATGIILACKPHHWIKEFPRSIKPSRELVEKTKAKWGKFFE